MTGPAGAARQVGPAAPLPLDEPGCCWLVVEGGLDIEAVRLDEQGRATGPGRFLFRVGPGGIALGMAAIALAGGIRLALLGRAAESTRVAPFEPVRAGSAAVGLLEEWAGGLAAAARVERIAPDAGPNAAAPYAAALARIAAAWEAEDAARATWLRRRLLGGERLFRSGLGALAEVLQRSRPAIAEPAAAEIADEADALAAALRLVARESGIRLGGLSPGGAGPLPDRIETVLRAAGLASRRVRLSPGWERFEGGPMLGMLEAGADALPHPVALLPTRGGYDIVDPAQGTAVRAPADSLAPVAWVLYRTLPAAPGSVGDLLRFGLAGSASDVRRLILTGLAGALLALVLPLVTAPLFSDVLPRADYPAFAAIVVAMAVAAMGQVAFGLVRSFAVLRIEGRAEAAIQAALWERVLHLPAGFFRAYSVGDLTDRVTNVTAIRSVLSSSVVRSVLDTAFSVISLILLFWYSWRLALVAIGLAVAAVAVTVLFLALQMPLQRAAMERSGRLSGLALQLLVAAAKLRAGGAEARLFARWSELCAGQKHDLLGARRLAAGQMVFSQVFATLTTLVIFAAMIWLGEPVDTQRVPLLPVGTFMSFYAAFGQFMAALIGLVSTAAMVIAVVPMFDRIRPLLEAIPETDPAAEPPGELSGDIEFQGVSFRYAADAPKVIDGLSFHIRPGEHVALVGPSGSGKSTVIRLLLGFERPSTGAVLLDGRDLATLDLKAVRAQAGVVLQHGALLPGTIFENIAGSGPFTLNEAWQAARLAGFDDDIRTMPMGMHTMLSDAVSTISGGQRQRLLIARALIRRPRLLIFDEATSALDGHTQAIIDTSLSALSITRLVVAHRLSTVRNADRILVLQGGRLVEDGTFEALMGRNGLFTQLARRQEA